MMPPGVSLHLSSPSTLLFLVLITIVTTLLAGFYPAEVLSSHLPVINLKGQTAKKFFQTEVLRKGLIVFQFTVSLVFIICTLVIGKQIRFMMNKDLGFAKDAIVSFRTGWNEPIDQAGIFAEKVRQIAGVQLVSTHLETPVAKSHSNTYIQRVDNPEFKPGASYEMCDEHYVPLYDLHIIAGRNILHSDTVREFLVNETCVRELGFKKGEDALGIRVQNGMNEAKGTIVGVVKDFHSKSLHEPIRSFFLSSDKNSERSISVKLATREGDISHFRATMAAIEKNWKELYPNEKFEYSFFDETIARLYATEQRTSQLMNAATVIAVLISCMGLLGLAIFTIQRRTKEIGVRKVLGASVAGIVSILCKDFVILVIMALVIASPISWYFMHGWLQDFAYRVPIGGWVFLIAGLAAIGITLITISYQAVKAAIASPIKALRTGD
jgi:hypothetical protein